MRKLGDRGEVDPRDKVKPSQQGFAEGYRRDEDTSPS